jgi:hypothetical protein
MISMSQYSTLCLTWVLLSTFLIFLPLYEDHGKFNVSIGSHEKELDESLQSDRFRSSVLMCIFAAIPMTIDVVLDFPTIFYGSFGKFFEHIYSDWVVRVYCCLTLPYFKLKAGLFRPQHWHQQHHRQQQLLPSSTILADSGSIGDLYAINRKNDSSKNHHYYWRQKDENTAAPTDSKNVIPPNTSRSSGRESCQQRRPSNSSSARSPEDRDEMWHWVCRAAMLSTLTIPNMLYSVVRTEAATRMSPAILDRDLFFCVDVYRLIAPVGCIMAYVVHICKPLGRLAFSMLITLTVGLMIVLTGMTMRIHSRYAEQRKST